MMFWLRKFRVKFQHIFKDSESKAGNVEIIIFTSSAHDLVCPAKYLTYCSQRQTQHTGRRGFLLIWKNVSVLVISQYFIFPQFTLTPWKRKKKQTESSNKKISLLSLF